MFAIGQLANTKRRSRQAFTLVELILVMTILCIAITAAAPSMGNFFRGRTQEAEARRILALIRYGQSRAVDEGIPVLLWFDSKSGVYGIEQDPTYVEDDPKAVEFNVDSHLAVDTRMGPPVVHAPSNLTSARVPAYPTIRGRTYPAIRFQPDGAFGSSSPNAISIAEGQSSVIWIVQAQNGLSYEIERN